MPIWVTLVVTIAAVLTAAGIIWKAVKSAAKAITQRETVTPILAALAAMAPPLLSRLDSIEHRLDAIERRING